MKRVFIPLLVVFVLFASRPNDRSVGQVSAHSATLSSGALFRGENASAVYYLGEDGLRYIFPNDKTYFTWYNDFDEVRVISDAELAGIQIGGNVTYKPGVKMVKIQSDGTVYAVSKNGTLRAIASEKIAEALYGFDWNTKIDDVPDGFFSNYEIGRKIDEASMFLPSVEISDAQNINDDKNLHPATIVEISGTGYDEPTIHIKVNTAVRWMNVDPNGLPHTVTEWDNIWGSGTLKAGESFTRYFSETGTWTYYSEYDAKEKMTGAIIVE